MATEFHRAHSLSCLNDLFVFSCRAHCGHSCYEPSFWNQMQRCWYGISSSSSEGGIVFKILVMFLHFNMHLILSFASSLLQRPLAIAHCIYFNVRNRLQIDMADTILIARLILRFFLLMNSILSAVRTLQFKTGNHDQEWPDSNHLSHLRWSWCLVMHTGGLVKLLTVGYWDQSGCRNSCLLLAQDLHKSGLFLLQISEATDELSNHMLLMVNLMI